MSKSSPFSYRDGVVAQAGGEAVHLARQIEDLKDLIVCTDMSTEQADRIGDMVRPMMYSIKAANASLKVISETIRRGTK